MRTRVLVAVGAAGAAGWAAACASAPTFGPLGEGAADYLPNITAVDTAHPPTSASLALERDAYAVLLLVAPGHSATLLFPSDSTTSNRFTAGAHDVAFQIPGPLVRADSARGQRVVRSREQLDSATRARARTGSRGAPLPPLQPNTVTYLLVVTSPQPLVFGRVIEKTAGWSIPLEDLEALNAVAKNIKATLTREPREWAGFYRQVRITAVRK